MSLWAAPYIEHLQVKVSGTWLSSSTARSTNLNQTWNEA
uniref:Uncharacterized protein n=1 Tax=Arundo donax TaxID=35708 RepID=A0A0A9BKB8_ARUDO